MNLRELIRAAMLAAFKSAGKVTPTKKRRQPQKRLQYPRASDPQSIAHYDAAVMAWIAKGREGAKPIRRVEPRKFR